MTDTEILDWLSATKVGGRRPSIAFDGRFEIWDQCGYLLGDGRTLRLAVENAVNNERRCLPEPEKP